MCFHQPNFRLTEYTLTYFLFFFKVLRNFFVIYIFRCIHFSVHYFEPLQKQQVAQFNISISYIQNFSSFFSISFHILICCIILHIFFLILIMWHFVFIIITNYADVALHYFTVTIILHWHNILFRAEKGTFILPKYYTIFQLE